MSESNLILNPPCELYAARARGRVAQTLTQNLAQAEQQLQVLQEHAIDLSTITDWLALIGWKQTVWRHLLNHSRICRRPLTLKLPGLLPKRYFKDV